MTVSAKDNYNHNHMVNNIFHLQFHHDHNQELKDIPKGCLAVMVGTQADEQQRFVIPVIYINHPLFMQLLKEAEEEYGFDHNGPITIPCHVEQFIAVQGLIDKENSDHYDDHDHHHHHHHHHNHVWCFRVWFHH